LSVTDAIRPATRLVLAGAGAGEGVGACACAVVEPVGPAGAVGAAVFELPHAATDSAVAPTTANIPSRVIGANEPAVFTLPQIMTCGRVSRPVILESAGILGVRCSEAVHDIWRLGAANSERVFGNTHDVIVNGFDDFALRGQFRKHVLGEERRGRDLALVEGLIAR
jgi:hypothetical protein